MKKNKFNVGDKVDFVNDYGVIFKDKTITEVNFIDGVYRYQVEPNDTPWFLKYEKNLHLAGTYDENSLDLELNNGMIAKFAYCDDNANKIYKFEHEGLPMTAILIDGSLHSISDFEEPIGSLKDEFQPKQQKKEIK